MDVHEALHMVDGGPHHIGEWAEAATTLAAEVRRLAGAVPAGCVRDETGADVPFVGTLPRTADGVIVGHNADIFVRGGFKADAVGNGVAWGPVTLDIDTGERHRTAFAFDQCYSTRAAAEAARERGGT